MDLTDKEKTPKDDENYVIDNLNYKPEPLFPPVKAAFISLIAVFLLYQIGGSILTLLIFGLDFQNADVNALRLLTAAGQILLILVPALFLAKLIFADVTHIIRFRLPDLKEIGIFVLGLIILIPLLQNYLFIQNYVLNILAENSPFINSVKEFIDKINDLVEKTYSDLLRADNIFETILIIVVVSFVPAICEEVFFRGFAQSSFEYKFKPLTSSIITAIFFGFYHFNPYGLIALIALGVYLGFATYVSNSIIVPMILHFLNNFIAIMAYFLFEEEELLDTAVTANDSISNYLLSFSILFVLFLIFIIIIKKFYQIKKITAEQKNDMSKM